MSAKFLLFFEPPHSKILPTPLVQMKNKTCIKRICKIRDVWSTLFQLFCKYQFFVFRQYEKCGGTFVFEARVCFFFRAKSATTNNIWRELLIEHIKALTIVFKRLQKFEKKTISMGREKPVWNFWFCVLSRAKKGNKQAYNSFFNGFKA